MKHRAAPSIFALAAVVLAITGCERKAQTTRPDAAFTAPSTFASVPALPFGGIGESGFGRIHGEDGLKEFTRAKSITRQRVPLPVNLMSFGRPANAADALARVMGLVHGRHR